MSASTFKLPRFTKKKTSGEERGGGWRDGIEKKWMSDEYKTTRHNKSGKKMVDIIQLHLYVKCRLVCRVYVYDEKWLQLC